MECPTCKEHTLAPVLTKQGVEIDYCAKCSGVWLDENEIYHFTSTPGYLKQKIAEAMDSAKPSLKVSPVFNKPMVELALFEGLVIDYDTASGGIWLDKDEINLLPAVNGKIEIDPAMIEKYPVVAAYSALLPLPNLMVRSVGVLTGMYGLLGLFLIIVVEFGGISAGAALLVALIIAVFQFLFGPFLMDLFLRWFFRLEWVAPEELPSHLKNFIQATCQQNNVKFPRMGIIADGSPNAFTYGHHPNNARIVITRGLMNLLDEKEVEAVVAHEIGHVVHWDMLVMTLAHLVPLVLYYIYRTLSRARGRGKGAAAQVIIAFSAYVLYIVSEYIVLWFSRIREFFADRFSGIATGDPSTLASALVKIGYGLAGDDSGKKENQGQSRKDTLSALGPMGIFDSKTANILAVAGYGGPARMGGSIDKEKLKDTAKWDLWNPWAVYYELQSTHPLIAKRLKFLSNQSAAMGKEPFVEFDERKPESFWDEFFVDLAVKSAPFLLTAITAAAFFTLKYTFILAPGLFLIGLALFFELQFSYPAADFAPMNIQGLLKKIKVSAVRPVPCTVKGKIIGRGIPGLIVSEDFVLQDQSGIIFLDYNQPLGMVFNFLFGLLRAQRYIGQEVEIIGWYRRAPVPYIEIRRINSASEGIATCYIYNAKMCCAVLLMAAGGFFLLKSLLGG